MKSTKQISMFSFAWLFWPPHQNLLALLSQKGEETRFIGGAIRNSLLHQETKDFDCATTHRPEKVMEILTNEGIKVVPTGLAHGTVTAVIDHRPYEITTLRQDIETYGRHAKVAFTDSWKEDAARRDFTINALSLNAQGQLFDYFGGIEDLEKRHVRFIGQAEKRIQEDYLRILRFFRFQAFYGAEPFDAEALEACIVYKSFLTSLARERITQEFLKILAAPAPLLVLRTFEEEGFFPFILDQTTDFSLLNALLKLESAHHLQASPLVRLSALLGRKIEAPRLCFSRNQQKMLGQFSQSPPEITPATFPSLFYRFSPDIVRGWVYLQLAEKRRHKGDAFDTEAHLLHALCEFEKTWAPPPFPLNGKDVLALGVQGKEIRELLDQVENWWIEEKFSPTRSACLAYLKSCFLLNNPDHS